MSGKSTFAVVIKPAHFSWSLHSFIAFSKSPLWPPKKKETDSASGSPKHAAALSGNPSNLTINSPSGCSFFNSLSVFPRSFKNSGVLVFSWPGISVDVLEPSDVEPPGATGAQAESANDTSKNITAMTTFRFILLTIPFTMTPPFGCHGDKWLCLGTGNSFPLD